MNGCFSSNCLIMQHGKNRKRSLMCFSFRSLSLPDQDNKPSETTQMPRKIWHHHINLGKTCAQDKSILKRGVAESAFATSSCHHVLVSLLMRLRTRGAVAIKEITARDWAVMKTVAVAGAPDLRVQAVRISLAVPPFSTIACASAASASGIIRSTGIVNLPSRTASA
jgi:hypothetical protein